MMKFQERGKENEENSDSRIGECLSECDRRFVWEKVTRVKINDKIPFE